MEPAESWEVAKAVTVSGPSTRVSFGHMGRSSPALWGICRSRAAHTAGEAKIGAPVCLLSTRRPAVWSLWVWVMKMADSSGAGRPKDFRAFSMRRAEMPASTRICSPSAQTRAALPSEPLARV